MKSLTYARQCARRRREAIGALPDGLLDRVSRYLFDTYGIELHPVNQAFLEGGQAEVSPAEGCLFYDERLDAEPLEKLMMVLHEVGHLELHPRLHRCCARPDPVFGSMYLNDGASALARYHHRSREEAEANAFATEFLCPSQEVLQDWCQHPHEPAARLAQRWRIPVSVVRAQLAEALYWQAMGAASTSQESARRVYAADPSQLEAATATGCPVLIHAGPGTGKTATLVRRITYLLEACQAAPEQLLVLTFSNDAAEELRQRVAAVAGEQQAARIEISTFHGFGLSFLYHHGQFLQVDARAAVLDDTAQAELVSSLLGTVACESIVRLQHPDETVRDMVRHISYLKDRLLTPDDVARALAAWQPSAQAQPQHAAAQAFLRVYRAYEDAKKAQHGVDFADLIALPSRILHANTALRQAYREKYKWVMVDEYQDVSRAVASLLRQLCGADNPPWVVGDAHQAIYRFRGAAPENVAQFDDDFPGARVFNLDTNYRSCDAIVQAANQLAGLMDRPAGDDTLAPVRWHCGTPWRALVEPAVVMANANSDAAEQEGIAHQIETWLTAGIAAQDIAVLARRNIDVRNIVLSLGKRGVRGLTAGLLTPEGAAGDLAAITTLIDQPRASLPRLAVALGRERYSAQVINAVIQHVLQTCDTDGLGAAGGPAAGRGLIADIRRVYDALYAERFSGDAFTMICVFLFDSSDYLRRILEQPGAAGPLLALSEIVTSLAKAAGYRFLHTDTDPRKSRVGFAHMFRAALGGGAPSVIPPQPTPDAVRVMTCHAAKGLEFPCVIVAGQTLSQASQRYAWLPPALASPAQDESEQADALLFVGTTRAQQALVVTYASSAGGTARARLRQVTPLLERWQTHHAMPTCNWTSQASGPRRITMEAIWGGAANSIRPARVLDKSACPLRTYLEHDLRVRFPVRVRSLYPIFFAALRRAMGDIVRRAQERQAPIQPQEARAIFLDRWPGHEVAEHPHAKLYGDTGGDYVERFAHAYRPDPKACAPLDLLALGGTAQLPLRHDLLAHYRAEDGTPVAMIFRPESLDHKARENGLLWSALSPAQRVSFVMLKQHEPDLRPYVFSAQDGVIYPYLWPSRPQDLAKETAAITRQLQALSQQRFETTVQMWTCERCPVRVSCPHWLGLQNGPSHQETPC